MDNKQRNQTILELTCELLGKMSFEVENAYVEDLENEEGETQVLVAVTVPENRAAQLIGFRGRNLVAMQLILGLMVKNKMGEWIRVLLDINNYRQEQKTRLEGMAKNLAQKVLQTGKAVEMANMSSYERRICHMVIKEIEGVVSESEGEGEQRHVIIKLKE